MERVLGAEVGRFIRALHEEHGVIFHLGTTVASIDERSVTLKNGETLAADLVVVGIGVRPALALAEQAGLAIDRGVASNEYLETSVAGHLRGRRHRALAGSAHAASRSASSTGSWPSARARPRRATCSGGASASTPCRSSGPSSTTSPSPTSAMPNGWDEVEIDGTLDARDCTITYRRDGRKLAVAVVQRDLEGLRAEVEFERALRGERVAREFGEMPDDHEEI